MKPIRMLGRSIRDAVKSVIRNFSLSLASISCITITLIILLNLLTIVHRPDNMKLSQGTEQKQGKMRINQSSRLSSKDV